MAAPGKKKENLSILKEIYDDSSPEQQPKFKDSVKQYFKQPQKVDRLLAGAILFFGLAALVLGFFQFKSRISSYFLPKDGPGISLEAPQNLGQVDLLGLREKDTDQDGLSDFDELYIYSSSPYLKDTDSDGISDQQEVAQGTDPNCRQGENCFGIFDVGPDQADPTSLLPSTQLQAAQIRLLLAQAGVAPEELNQLSDQDLVDLYQEIILESQTGATITLPVSQIEDLTPDQVRQLLLEQGIDKSILDNITDAELMDLVNETLVEF